MQNQTQKPNQNNTTGKSGLKPNDDQKKKNTANEGAGIGRNADQKDQRDNKFTSDQRSQQIRKDSSIRDDDDSSETSQPDIKEPKGNYDLEADQD